MPAKRNDMVSIWTMGKVDEHSELLERIVLNTLKGQPMGPQELYDCIFSSISELYELRPENLRLLPDTINNLTNCGKIGVRAKPMARNSFELSLELFSTI